MKATYLIPLALASLSTAAAAQSNDFSAPVVDSPTKAPGVWYTDRYAPNGFQTSGGKLIETIAASDQQATGTPPSIGFYNTQGRTYDLNPGTNNLSIDLTIDSSWASTDKRWAGLWGISNTTTPGDINYPILEFTTDGGTARFRGYNVNDGTWMDLIPTGGIVFGNTYTLDISLSNNIFTYSVGGATASVAATEPSASINSVILQGYNTGTNYSIMWDNLKATAGVPEPASWSMMIIGVGMIGGALRRRQRIAVRFA